MNHINTLQWTLDPRLGPHDVEIPFSYISRVAPSQWSTRTTTSINSSTMPDAYCYRTDRLPRQRGYDGCFESYQTFCNLPRETTALAILRRVAYIVAPIMRRQRWSVPLLNELPMYHPDLGTMISGHVKNRTKFMGLPGQAAFVMCVRALMCVSDIMR
jgi:hypothetical protein